MISEQSTIPSLNSPTTPSSNGSETPNPVTAVSNLLGFSPFTTKAKKKAELSTPKAPVIEPFKLIDGTEDLPELSLPESNLTLRRRSSRKKIFERKMKKKGLNKSVKKYIKRKGSGISGGIFNFLKNNCQDDF